MELRFPKVDLKSTILTDVKAGELYVNNLEDLHNEKAYRIKLNFPKKDGKIYNIFVINDSQPCVYMQDTDRFVYVIKKSINTEISKNTNMLNSVKQQIAFIFEDDVNKTIYIKTDKTKDNDIGIIRIGEEKGKTNSKNDTIDFSGEKIVFKEGDRKIRTINVQFQLKFD